MLRTGFERVSVPRRRPGGPARLLLPDADGVKVHLEAVCHDCRHRHRIYVNGWEAGAAIFDWRHKHAGHHTEIISGRRDIPRGFDDRLVEREGVGPWWLRYAPNADIKLAYAADAAFTITLASLAESNTWVAGREATSVSNGSNKYLDYEITGKITVGTSPTAETSIELRGIKPINDTPTWPDVFDGTDSAETITNTQIRDKQVRLWDTAVAATSDIGYPITLALTLAEAWGFVPDNFTVFVAHNTDTNLHATGGNHEINYRGVYGTSI
jgi:hypothetical protein